MTSRRGTRVRREDTAALTRRQEEVLRLLARGYTNGQIAEELGISLDGAKFHVGEIMGKLQVSTREEAVEAWRARRPNAVRGLAFLGLRWGAGALAAGLLWLALRSGLPRLLGRRSGLESFLTGPAHGR